MITSDDLHQEVYQCYNEHDVVSAMKKVINWSGLYYKSGCLKKINQITPYQFFMLTPAPLDEGSTKSFDNKVNCLLKTTVVDVWDPLPFSDYDGNCLLKEISNLA